MKGVGYWANEKGSDQVHYGTVQHKEQEKEKDAEIVALGINRNRRTEDGGSASKIGDECGRVCERMPAARSGGEEARHCGGMLILV